MLDISFALCLDELVRAHERHRASGAARDTGHAVILLPVELATVVVFYHAQVLVKSGDSLPILFHP